MGRKKDPDATPAEKLISLYTMLLLHDREFSLSEFARELNCSKQTIVRMIDQLENSRFGKLCHDKRGRESIYRLERPKRLPKLCLDADGLSQLALCRDFMIHLLPDAMKKKADTALFQATAYLSESEDGSEESNENTSGFSGLAGRSYVKGHIDYTPFQGIWQTLTKAIKAHRICKVSYQKSPKGEARTFSYAPKLIISYHETVRFSGWVVTEKGEAAYDHSTDLLLHRIREATATRQSSEHLPTPKKEHEGAFGLIDDEPFSVAIRFKSFSAPYAAEREWSVNQTVEWNDDGGAVLTMTARSSAEVISWILSFGDEAELLSPQWLREEITRKIDALVEVYK